MFDESDLTRFIIGTSIATVFSLLTLIVITVKQEMKSLQVFIYRCYIASYTGCMILLTTYGLLRQYLENFVDSILYRCTIIGSFYFFSATMFWLNVMSIDIWMTFRKLRSNPGANVIEGQGRKLVCYLIYAWGSPIVHILVIRYCEDPGADLYTTISISKYLPIIGIIICNICMLIPTAFMIKQRVMGTTGIGYESARLFLDNCQWFSGYVMVFGMMTLVLILMVIGWFTDWMYPLTSLVEKQSFLTFSMSIYWRRTLGQTRRDGHCDTAQISLM